MRKILCITMAIVCIMSVGCSNEIKEIVSKNITGRVEIKETESEVITEIETTANNPTILAKARYKIILDKYYQALSESWDWDKLEANGLCYLCMYYEGVSDIGYTFIDVDNNGVEELLIGEMNAEGGYVGMFFDMYAIVDDEVVLVTTSGERDRYYLCSGYNIANEASSGAALSAYAYYKFTGDEQMKLIEAVIFDGFIDEENPWFYSNTGLSEEDYNANPIKEDTATAIKDKYEYMKIEFKSFEKYK